MVGMNPPHSPYRSLDDCMEEDFNLYKDQPIDSLLIRPNADRQREKAESARYYFASVSGVDRAFGQILDCLKELKLDKNTIVVFTSDHGETMCSQFTDDPKNSPYAESMNVPFLVRYPQHIRPRVDNLLLSSPDIMPTCWDFATWTRIFQQTYREVITHRFSMKIPCRPSLALRVLYTSKIWMEIKIKTEMSFLISPVPEVSRRSSTHWHYTSTEKTN